MLFPLALNAPFLPLIIEKVKLVILYLDVIGPRGQVNDNGFNLVSTATKYEETGSRLSVKVKLSYLYHYRPQTKLRKGNVFTPVCQSFCSQGGLPSAYWDTPPWVDTPWADTSPGQTPLLGRHPSPADTLLSRHPHTRRLLLRMVCILLECILVCVTFC